MHICIYMQLYMALAGSTMFAFIVASWYIISELCIMILRPSQVMKCKLNSCIFSLQIFIKIVIEFLKLT